MEEYLIRMGHLRLDDEKLIQNIMSMDIEKQETIKFEDFAKYMSLFFWLKANSGKKTFFYL